jgi:hypothetical protein
MRRDGPIIKFENSVVTLHSLYSSASIIRMIKSKRMRWAGHVAGRGEKRNAYRILVGKPEGKRPQDVGGRTILKWILKR